MTAVCLQHTSDGPVIKRDPQNRVRVTREPDPGELWRFTQSRLAWFENPPRGVRHLQLVHFMRSDLGDNQTESPTQGGLTPLGRDVIAECNRLGMVVDVAHGTLALVEGAARASRTPLILSHTNLASRRLDPFTRLISGDHGKLVASTGGVVWIWASPTFTLLAGYVDGVTRAVETLGVDHVGFGTDNSGFGQSRAVWTDYADFPLVVQLLRRKGFSATDVGKLVGGSYVRVFNQSMPASG